MSILVTGAAGFIGSHTCVRLIDAGYNIVAADNFANSDRIMIDRIKEITGKDFPLYEYDLAEYQKVEEIFRIEEIEAVIHFAAYKIVSESLQNPLKYYLNNLCSSMNLLKAMGRHDVKSFVFSSSACVYGDCGEPPFTEQSQMKATHPYAGTKCMTEQILQDVGDADPRLGIVILRYFNPIGAHESGLIGENLSGEAGNLMPMIINAALGNREQILVYGNDYDTVDGTGVRDYLHVMDLADGHIAALRKSMGSGGINIYNLGTGSGYSVLELINTFEKANGIKVPHKFEVRRSGDVATSYADASAAERELGWVAKRSLEDMCRDAWRYAQRA